MSNQEDIDHQKKLLAIYRKNLRHLLEQAARDGGEEHIDVKLANEINDTRDKIRHIEATLRDWGVSDEDLSDDETPPNPYQGL
jgi:hypothetical protein